jgi:hypothetical protein
MAKPHVMPLVLLVLLGPPVLAQTHAPDGGTRTTITSIAVPPMPDAPFSATVTTEWTRYLENGAMQIIKNHRMIARDGQGRVFQERRWLAAEGSPNESRLTRTEIADPRTHTIALCDPDQQVCELQFYRPAAATALPPAGPSSNGASSLKRESLGTQTVNGLELIGTREVLTVSPAAAGTDRPLSVTKEFWYSPRLGLNVSTTRSDPRNGLEVLTVTDINPSEPDSTLFVVPKDAHLIDRRTPAQRR